MENKQYTVKEFNKRIKRIADTIDTFGTPIDEHMKTFAAGHCERLRAALISCIKAPLLLA